MTEMLMSVEGLYTADEDLFVGLQVPEGMEKQTVIDAILLECMELEVLYPRPETMKNMIGIWSAKEINTWKRVYAAEQAEYNPIENYDRHQTDSRQETHSGDDVTVGANTTNTTGTSSGTSSGSSSGQNGTTTTATGNLSDTTTHKFAAFNAGELQDQTQDVQSANSSNNQTEQSANQQTTQGTTQENTTGSLTENRRNTLTHGEQVGETFTSYIHGNIGVTTSQQMLESELELAPKINTINYIVNSFKMRFCILVY